VPCGGYSLQILILFDKNKMKRSIKLILKPGVVMADTKLARVVEVGQPRGSQEKFALYTLEDEAATQVRIGVAPLAALREQATDFDWERNNYHIANATVDSYTMGERLRQVLWQGQGRIAAWLTRRFVSPEITTNFRLTHSLTYTDSIAVPGRQNLSDGSLPVPLHQPTLEALTTFLRRREIVPAPPRQARAGEQGTTWSIQSNIGRRSTDVRLVTPRAEVPVYPILSDEADAQPLYIQPETFARAAGTLLIANSVAARVPQAA
jgi:hypothetical protein